MIDATSIKKNIKINTCSNIKYKIFIQLSVSANQSRKK